MKAGRYVLRFPKGGTLERTFRYKRRAVGGPLHPVDVSQWRARAAIRKRPDTEPCLIFDSDPAAVDRDGDIVLGADGTIMLRASAEVTAGVTIERGTWALELTSPENVRIRLLEGDAIMTPRVVPPAP